MKFPVIIRYRKAEAKIYGKRPGYPWYRLAYYANGKRRTRSFKKLGEARSEAERILRDLAGGSDAPALSPKAARGALLAVELLRELAGTLQLPKPPGIDEAVAEYVEAKRRLGGRRLIEAVEGWLSTVAQVRRVTVRQAADEYLRERERLTRPSEAGRRPALSPKMHYQDELRLNRFAKAFQMDVCDLGKDHLDLFFREHLRGLAGKSRNHFRGTLRQWFAYCVKRDYLPRDHRLLDAPGIANEKADGEEIEIYTAAEFAALLAHADPALVPVLAIGGLAGLRAQELLRLEWADVWRRPGYIEVTKAKAKTRSRRLVPIQPALAAWLAPHRGNSEGGVWFQREWSFHDYFRLAATAAGIERRDNALRHSFITHRLAATGNENQVAQEAGTSPAMIHAHYRALATREEGEQWFNVFPPAAAANIVPMPQEVAV